MRDETRETRHERARERETREREKSEQENISAGDYISKLPGPK
jgi:hypothetical protein